MTERRVEINFEPSSADDSKLVEVRCPAILTTKKGHTIRCDHLCCIAAAGSIIRIKCRHCKNVFEAYIPSNVKSPLDVAYREIKQS